MTPTEATALIDAFSHAEQRLTLWTTGDGDPGEGVRLGRAYGAAWLALVDALTGGWGGTDRGAPAGTPGLWGSASPTGAGAT